MSRNFSRSWCIAIIVVLCATAGWGGAGWKCMAYYGWITDSECLEKGATEQHSIDCARRVLSKGGHLLFYSEADGALVPVADPVAAEAHVGKRLKVDGHVEMVIHSFAAAEVTK